MRTHISIGIACLLLAFSACNNSASKKANTADVKVKQYKYVCTMHPEIGADKPGVCSKCGMDLVERDTTAK